MKNLKRSIITKSVSTFTLNQVIQQNYLPKAGDVAVFKVIEIGKHKRIQTIRERNRAIFQDDLILAAFGNRYATNQLEGYVPDEIPTHYHILGQGGVVGVMHTIHNRFERRGPTTLELIGYAMDKNGQVINTKVKESELSVFNPLKQRNCKVLLSVGSSMDSGKTTTAGHLCRGLRNANQKVAYIKLTGTVYSKDKWFVEDCGAHYVTDFAEFGFPSTYMSSLDELLTLHASLLDKVEEEIAPDYVVIEIADGLLQRETSMLLHHPSFMNTIDGLILSCGDSLSIKAGIDVLKNMGHSPFALSGIFTASPLLINEVQAITNIPILTREELQKDEVMAHLFSKDNLLKVA